MTSFLSRASAVLALLLVLLQPLCPCSAGCASGMVGTAKARVSAERAAPASACARRCAARRNAERRDASPCKRGGSCECALRAPVKITAPIAPEPPCRAQLALWVELERPVLAPCSVENFASAAADHSRAPPCPLTIRHRSLLI